MPSFLFYIFAVLTVIGSLALICFRNPVSSAMSMAAAFGGLAALFVSLGAFFVGIIQVLVYAGAIMVLFIFIIMLLDLKSEERKNPKALPIVGGLALVLIFAIQMAGVLMNTPNKEMPDLEMAAAAERYEAIGANTVASHLKEDKLPDVHLVGRELFSNRNREMQIVGVLLLVATIGTVVLSKRQKD